jgi:hypothetical protein
MNAPGNILIGTPAYNGQLHVDYLHSILDIAKAGIPYSVFTIGNESLITRARNTLISTFHSMPSFTHLLFLDADVYLDAEGLSCMISHEKDVVGAPVYLKGKDSDGNQTLNTDANPNQLPVLQSVDRVGTAALLLSRTATNSLVQHAIEEKRVYENHKMLQRPEIPNTHYDIFRVGISNGEYLSEDFWICQELRHLGFEIFVDTSVYTRHNGMVAFD